MFVAFITTGALALGTTAASFFVRKEKERGYQDVENPRRIVRFVATGLAVLTLGFGGISTIYSQDVGEAKVLRSVSGEIVGESTVPGFHTKAPWVTAISWDVRDNAVEYAATGETNYSGGSATGPRITVQDRDGVQSHFDLTVRYSIAGDKVEELYGRFGSQQNLLTKLIEPGIRSTVREIPVAYSSLEIVNKRAEIQAAIMTQLSEAWAADGIIIESVDLQEIVQPEATTTARDKQAAATIAVETERANLEKARIEAEKNAVATSALTPEILADRYIAALDAGTVFIVPEGSTPMLQLPTLNAGE